MSSTFIFYSKHCSYLYFLDRDQSVKLYSHVRLILTMPDFIVNLSKLTAVPAGILGAAYVIVAKDADTAFKYAVLVVLFYLIIEALDLLFEQARRQNR